MVQYVQQFCTSEFITYLLIPECLQVLVDQSLPCLLYPHEVQEVLFHQEAQEDPTSQYHAYVHVSVVGYRNTSQPEAEFVSVSGALGHHLREK